MTTKPKKKFNLVIPHYYLENENLDFIQCGLLADIQAFCWNRKKEDYSRWCFVKNPAFAKKFKCSLSKIEKSIKKLRDLGKIEVSGDGKARKIRIVLTPYDIRSNTVRKTAYLEHISSKDFTKVKSRTFAKSKPKLTLKYRRNKKPPEELKYVQHVLDHWESKGLRKPKPDIATNCVVKALKKHNRFQICQTIDVAAGYIIGNGWKYGGMKPDSLKTFMTSCYPVEGKEKAYFKAELPERVKLTWYNLFRLKDDEWLANNLLHMFATQKKDEYYDLVYNTFRNRLGLFDRETEEDIMVAASNMRKWTKTNGDKSYEFPFNTFETIFKNFVDQKGIHKMKLRYLRGKRFWNRQFNEFVNNTRGINPKEI